MAEVHLPRSLVSLFPEAPRRLEIAAEDLTTLIRALDERYPGMWDRLCEPGPRIREHINVFVDRQRVALPAKLDARSVVHIIPAVSGGSDEPDRIHPETVDAWRAWLAANHARRTGVWLVSWKGRTGRPRMTYEEAVEEALAWGWIDSRAGTLDAERSMLWYSPRRRGSGWSRPNKERIARLEAQDRMTPAGRAAIERAKADGSWSRLDGVEELIVPDDLAAAFEDHPPACERWDAFPRSARRGILEWIANARRPETRRKRVAETAELAQRGERAAQRRGPGPSDQDMRTSL
jgi:uncharacterized protein YdeI (YjbR/CyaY-like superfamily)